METAGVVTRTIELDAGGNVAEIPDRANTVLVTAPLGSRYGLRVERDGAWGPWVELEGSGDESPDSARSEDDRGEPVMRALGPLPLDSDASRVEVERRSGIETDVTLTFLLDHPASLPPGAFGMAPTIARAQTGVAQPPIMPRSAWTTAGWGVENSGCSDGPHDAGSIQAAVIHHTVTGNTYRRDQVADLLRAIHHAHVVINGWCDVGYNFMVDRFGTIWEAREGSIEGAVIGGHTKGFNTSTVGIALLGQHQSGASPTSSAPTGAATTAVRQVAEWKLQQYDVDPSGTTWLKNRSTTGIQRLAGGTWHLVPTILAHRDLGVTSCPGSRALPLVRNLPSQLVATRPTALPRRAEKWTAHDLGPGFVVLDRAAGLRPAGSVALPGFGAPASPSDGPLAAPSPPPVAVAARREGGGARGYVVHLDGILHPFGGAPGVAGRPAADIPPADLALAPDSGGWVIDVLGGVRGFGGQSDREVGPSVTGRRVIAGDLTDDGRGYLLEADGRLRPVGGVPDHQLAASVSAIDVAVRPDGVSGWVVSSDLILHGFGGAPTLALPSDRRPPSHRRVAAVEASESGHGGWLLTDDGQLWPFGGERLVLPLTTANGTAPATDVAPVAGVLSGGFTDSRNGRLLRALVDLFLGASATSVDVQYWEGRYEYHGGWPAVATDLARSDEWAGSRIDALYHDVLGRSPDAGGRRYWLEAVRDGLPLQHVGMYFYGSVEYQLAHGTSTGFVRGLYADLLGREPEADGLDYWVGVLESGLGSPVDVAYGFYASPESRMRRVTELYHLVLGRAPDPEGLAYWTGRLGGVDDLTVAAELALSQEFLRRADG